MSNILISPADSFLLGLPMPIIYATITLISFAVFTYVLYKRLQPLFFAAPDNSRSSSLSNRFTYIVKFWLLQQRQPRYLVSGVLHIAIFFGFLILLARTVYLALIGFWPNVSIPLFDSLVYSIVKDFASTVVLCACLFAVIRHVLLRPLRYHKINSVNNSNLLEAVIVLTLIITLMISENIFDASRLATNILNEKGYFRGGVGTFTWFLTRCFVNQSIPFLRYTHSISYFIHTMCFLAFLCYLPFGKHFHILTSFFNIFFMRPNRGVIKPVRYDVEEEKLADLDSIGVKKLEDFTWKHVLDFLTCADCGRCTDQCPANAAGRPLSPHSMSIKGRNAIFNRYPLLGQHNRGDNKVNNIYQEDEIWSCTTCGACEEECPLGIEHIDKIVDLRRGLVDSGNVPLNLHRAMSDLEKRGNPWGKSERSRADWVNKLELNSKIKVRILSESDFSETLFFVDSAIAYDERMQKIAEATSKLLNMTECDFGVLGCIEKDSGNDVRRIGEEMLFQELKSLNTETIVRINPKNIVVADPHAYNTLKNEYNLIPHVEHISQWIDRHIKSGLIEVLPLTDSSKKYTYHDPCYLGRHNSIYDAPRSVLDSVPGLIRIEMDRHKSRSFCCGGGGLMQFYEPTENVRISQLRIEMAKSIGADIIVTACPYCLVNLEDAIKISGMEDKLEVIDISELVVGQIKID